MGFNSGFKGLKQKPVICFNHKILHTRDSDSNQTVPWRVAFVLVLKPTLFYTVNHLHLTGSTVIRGLKHCKKVITACIRNVYSCNSAQRSCLLLYTNTKKSSSVSSKIKSDFVQNRLTYFVLHSAVFETHKTLRRIQAITRWIRV